MRLPYPRVSTPVRLCLLVVLLRTFSYYFPILLEPPEGADAVDAAAAAL
jgi:hypothetical protein